MTKIWCNGQWLSADRYPGAAQDRGAFLGLGLFETMLGLAGKLVFPDRHLARLCKSAERLGWSVELTGLPEIAAELLEKNRLTSGRARLRLIVTSGSGTHHDLAPGADRLVWLSAFPAGETPESLSVCLSPWPRNERSPLAGLKTACYAENIIALDHARKQGFEETIFANTAGHLCETATANLFLVIDGVLLTPPLDSGCLPGIGREVLLGISAANGIPAKEYPLTARSLDSADEIFVSSATRGPVPVTRCGDRVLEAGPVTAALGKAYAEAVEADMRE